MDTPPLSRIEIARSRAEAAKTYLAVGAGTVCGLLVLFLRAGGSAATTGTTSSDAAVTSSEVPYDDYSLGGGQIAQPSQSGGFPQAQSGTS